ncbi:ammonium transporter [Dongia soli]|uniref:Ammonium transporter n=2 Tax=Dongia soli TaxID=600628 RepID=A0ABU5EBN5_9PROT|nr:ammonium transporter [Dongia soli]MDY0883694.1 ammonium transporter [Dongia soli]
MAVLELAGSAALVAAPAWAQAEPTLNSGDTAWMLTATALVLMMTIPGLALFYGGMVRKMNVLSVIMQSFAITCLVSVIWMIAGYSLAFSGGNAVIGDFSRLFLKGMEVGALSGTIPESVFMCFQMTFAIITPALITGAFADRMKFSAMLLFTALWSLLVYSPVAHMVWAGTGLMFNKGVLDFAGGTVVHINAGIGGLVAALIGKRRGYGRTPMPPHNLIYSVTGAGLLWVGWFGFNAGSALTSGGTAGMAMAVTQIATAAAGLSWMFVEWALKKHPSVLGIISGAVAGLVAITPASGFVDPIGALIIGISAGIICFFAATSVKNLIGYDDALDAFGVHGIGGIVGAILTGVFATQAVKGGNAPVGLIEGNVAQVMTQVEGILLTVLWSAIGTFVILKVVDLIIGLRVTEEIERDGLDLGLHGETVQ